MRANELLLVALMAASGCGMSRLQTAHAVSALADECIATQIDIAETCTTQSECIARLEQARVECRGRRADICAAGKGCR